ncbi:MAG: D-alanyl-alanine synthetase A [Candidatus Roizmanbacteria bacterium GW2011_GWC2_37_13]|uniref:D-alanine--D-alanine ligase n=1 Tax=Candidatus Roizmanbacteria bacterium GW2011_GWC2_37_13 TaxID=1618486 RepID=A0A0G0ILY6_9BACT|nr:MAG: D-alanyl-alanine synthetase A [Candidatus Roizmanbacteria bacterium GW2011_GWC1_37_12]KKQ25229.1 MAG: D-alanyl-alanine synthetase A [Candidatus Roizmanbacteria bacterium GW2011_GWC2_37_13]
MVKNKKINIGLVFGGKSGEHEVSLLSAKSIYEALDKNKYNVFLIGVDKQGRWLLGNPANYLLNSTNPKLIALNKSVSTNIVPVNKDNSSEIIAMESGRKLGKIDVFFPIIHGTYGEDGSLQGMFEMINSAYVGAGVIGSALGMDKDVQKRLLSLAGINIAKFMAIRKSQFNKKTKAKILKKFFFPFFVKPANTGSSVGISKVHNLKEFNVALNDAFKYDLKIMIEEFIQGREIECSVMGNDKPIASVLGEVIPHHEFYSYEAKYIDENGADLLIPADLPKKVAKEIQETAVKTFLTLECSGFARVDFFLTPKNKIYINEINTLPGFTKISMFPKLFNASGISYPEILDRLINLAIEKKKEKDKLKRSYTP